MEPKEDLEYKDDEGNIGKGQTITDLAQNNKLMVRFEKVLWVFAVLFGTIIMIIIWLIIYVIQNNVFNNALNVLSSSC